MLPRLFFCAACRFPSGRLLCQACSESLYRNPSILKPPCSEIEGVASVLYSFERGQQIIRRWKDRRGSLLESVLLQARTELIDGIRNLDLFGVVPIPQSQERSYQRGHDSAFTVAEYFCRVSGLPLVALLALQESSPARQTGRSRFDRDHAEQAFTISSDFTWRDRLNRDLELRVDQGLEIRLLLVDDLITTGSTLGRAARVIKDYIPRVKCWAGTLGYRPRYSAHPSPSPHNDLPDVPSRD